MFNYWFRYWETKMGNKTRKQTLQTLRENTPLLPPPVWLHSRHLSSQLVISTSYIQSLLRSTSSFFSSSSDLSVPDVISPLFPPLSVISLFAFLSGIFWPFLNMFSHTWWWLMCSAVSCGGIVAASCVQHRAVPGLSSQRPPLQLPSAHIWRPAPNPGALEVKLF